MMGFGRRSRWAEGPGATLLAAWRRLSPLPGGKWAFSRIVGLIAPYSGTARLQVRELEPGYARITLREHWRVRNHLRSVHAVALVNLAELTSGLAVVSALAPGVRGIVTGLEIEYLKKARGTLVAESRCAPPAVTGEPVDVQAEAVVRDAAGEVVARLWARWRLAPREVSTRPGAS